jgi:hypothetical protein
MTIFICICWWITPSSNGAAAGHHFTDTCAVVSLVEGTLPPEWGANGSFPNLKVM